MQAFDIFERGGLANDAAFVAERVLTADELKTYVDTMRSDREEARRHWSYVLGRRLVREDRYEEAAKYLPAPNDKILQIYAKALHDGADEKLAKEERAAAWFHAAWLARYDGMELMGTQVAPDVFATEGSFEMPDLAKERLTGNYQKVRWDGAEEKKTDVPIPLRPSKEEVKRMKASAIQPDVRFHYRVVAGALAMKAAALLPDHSAEVADVINSAGLWVKDRDQKVAGRYFNVLERRGSGTEIGRAASAKHWFVEARGPWSDREQASYDAMHKELAPAPSEPDGQ
ncbi:MAG: hypothetical protein ABI946_04785 [Chthoniobacterales bacterium]